MSFFIFVFVSIRRSFQLACRPLSPHANTHISVYTLRDEIDFFYVIYIFKHIFGLRDSKQMKKKSPFAGEPPAPFSPFTQCVYSHTHVTYSPSHFWSDIVLIKMIWNTKQKNIINLRISERYRGPERAFVRFSEKKKNKKWISRGTVRAMLWAVCYIESAFFSFLRAYSSKVDENKKDGKARTHILTNAHTRTHTHAHTHTHTHTEIVIWVSILWSSR